MKLVTHYLVGCLDSKPSSLCPSDIERMGSTRRVRVCVGCVQKVWWWGLLDVFGRSAVQSPALAFS